MQRVTRVAALNNYQIDVEFDDRLRGVVSLADDLTGPVFEPLRDPQFFARVSVDEFGAVCWPNGLDLCPDSMHSDIQAAPGQTVTL